MAHQIRVENLNALRQMIFKFVDIKGVVRRRKQKDIRYNVRRGKQKDIRYNVRRRKQKDIRYNGQRTNNNLQNTTQTTRDRATPTSLKPRVDPGAPEG